MRRRHVTKIAAVVLVVRLETLGVLPMLIVAGQLVRNVALDHHPETLSFVTRCAVVG